MRRLAMTLPCGSLLGRRGFLKHAGTGTLAGIAGLVLPARSVSAFTYASWVHGSAVLLDNNPEIEFVRRGNPMSTMIFLALYCFLLFPTVAFTDESKPLELVCASRDGTSMNFTVDEKNNVVLLSDGTKMREVKINKKDIVFVMHLNE
jgi:hypothetical protein